eukprot:scaffold4201_cov178-Amphora_coffeaeformis.AAC.13
MSSEDQLKARYAAVGQGHILEHLDKISSVEERQTFLQQLEGIAVEEIAKLLESAQKTANNDDDAVITPFVGCIGRSSDAVTVEKVRPVGMDAIRQGQVAALVLAGGQGTRLGFSGPKGVYNIGLPSQKSLFEIMAERILKLRQLAGAEAQLPFYIMTSPINHAETEAYFRENNFFGLGEENVMLFQQGMLPCLTTDGKIILETKSKVAMAPDGNGGIYPALQSSGALDHMDARGVKYLHIFSIDNALVKPADPVFIGHCISQGADCGNKSVWKAHPHEKVGVVALRNGKPCVVEYSEISKEMAEQVDAHGRLAFGAGNICNHFYRLDFLRNVVLKNMGDLYHIAHKKIPYYDADKDETVNPESNTGIKLETFIFDVFPLAKNMAIFEAMRKEEFAPVKNAPGSSSDSPDTARTMISDLSKTWLVEAGVTLENDGDAICEVLPLTSYAGEGLEKYKGETVKVPFMI